MKLCTTGRPTDDTSHAPVQQADEEHDTEITVLVTPPPENIRPILETNHNPPMTSFQSPSKVPATTNAIWAAMTSSPSSPESPEHIYSQNTLANNNEAGDQLESHAILTKPHTRRIKRVLTCELDHKAQSKTHQDNTSANQTIQLLNLADDEKGCDWLHTNQPLNKCAITNPTTSEQCIAISPAINLRKKKRKMLFVSMDFNNLSMDALIDSEELVNSLPESEFENQISQLR